MKTCAVSMIRRRSKLSASAPETSEKTMIGSVFDDCTSATIEWLAVRLPIAQAAPTAWISEPRFDTWLASQDWRKVRLRSGARVAEAAMGLLPALDLTWPFLRRARGKGNPRRRLPDAPLSASPRAMTGPRYIPLVESLPAAVPFVGPGGRNVPAAAPLPPASAPTKASSAPRPAPWRRWPAPPARSGCMATRNATTSARPLPPITGSGRATSSSARGSTGCSAISCGCLSAPAIPW